MMLTTPEGPKVLQAVGLGLAVMARTKESWEHIRANMPTDIHLTSEQHALLDEHRPVLQMVRSVRMEGVSQTVNIFACPECGRWGLISSGSVPSKCTLTLRCPGKPTKAKAATRVGSPSGSTED